MLLIIVIIMFSFGLNMAIHDHLHGRRGLETWQTYDYPGVMKGIVIILISLFLAAYTVYPSWH